MSGRTSSLKMTLNFKDSLRQMQRKPHLTQTSAPSYQEWNSHPQMMITLPSQWKRNQRISKTWQLQHLTTRESILLLGCKPHEPLQTPPI